MFFGKVFQKIIFLFGRKFMLNWSIEKRIVIRYALDIIGYIFVLNMYFADKIILKVIDYNLFYDYIAVV